MSPPPPTLPGRVDPLEERVLERTRLLMRAKRTWEATFDAISDPLALVDPQLRIIRTNRAHAEAAGTDVRTSPGQLCHEVLFGRNRPCEGCPAKRALATARQGTAEVSDERGGHRRVYRVSAFPLRHEDTSSGLGDVTVDPQAAPIQAVCHYRDITEEKALTRQLLQSEKMVAVGTLAGGVAHEINNPLGAIQAFAQLALLDVEPGTLLHEYVVEIERSTHRCQKIVRSLLDFSRPSVGERREVSLADVVDKVLFLVSAQTRRAPLRLLRRADDGAPPILGDANQLEQVVLNLVTNAIQALDGRLGEVVIAIEGRDGGTKLSVSDDGPGIAEGDLPKVFEPFFTTKPEGKGTGLGLYITYGIVAEHGGRIEVTSDPGVRTAFSVWFPAASGASDARTARQESRNG